MQELNLSAEDLEEAIKMMGGNAPQMMDTLGNAITIVTEAAQIEGGVPNVIKEGENELRCVVLKDGLLKPTKIDYETGISTQEFNPEEDVIAWLILLNHERILLKQDAQGVEPVHYGQFNELFKEKQGYILSFLSSINSGNNVLLDDAKVKLYDEVTAYVDTLIGENDHQVKSFIVAMLIKTTDWKEVTASWNDAELIDLSKSDTFEWGCTVETKDQYVKFHNTYAILWMQPEVHDPQGNKLTDDIVQIIIRQANPETVPQLGSDSKAKLLVEETLNEQVKAIALITDDTLNGSIHGMRLLKTKDFDVNKTSF